MTVDFNFRAVGPCDARPNAPESRLLWKREREAVVSTCMLMLSVPTLLSHSSCGATSRFSHSLVAARRERVRPTCELCGARATWETVWQSQRGD